MAMDDWYLSQLNNIIREYKNDLENPKFPAALREYSFVKLKETAKLMDEYLDQLRLKSMKTINRPTSMPDESPFGKSQEASERQILNVNLDNFKDSLITLQTGDVIIHDSTDILLNSTVFCSETVLSSFDFDINETYVPPSFDFPSLLNSSSEEECQRKLKTSSEVLLGIGNLSTYMSSKFLTVDGREQEITSLLAAKIDFLSLKGPLFIEMKAKIITGDSSIGDIEMKVLNQVLARIYRLRCNYAQLKLAVGFPVTSRFAWCIIFRRDRHFNETVNIWRINHSEIFTIWSSMTAKFISTPNYFLMEDAPTINSCLMKLGFHPSLCGVRMENNSIRSSHHVYHIYLPRHCQENSRSVLGIPLTEPNFSIKVHKYNDRYLKESEMIIKVRKQFLPQDHFYGRYGLQYTPYELFEKKEITSLDYYQINSQSRLIIDTLQDLQIDNEKEEEKEENQNISSNVLSELIKSSQYLYCTNIWDFFNLEETMNNNHHGGVIVMYSGQIQKITQENIHQVIDGVTKSLKATHLAGICHGDVRSSNILYFHGGFQLIDYDCAITTGDSIELVEGAIFNNRGINLQSKGLGDCVVWERTDDYEMLLELVKRVIFKQNQKF